jgi:HAMP domain-containing protein
MASLPRAVIAAAQDAPVVPDFVPVAALEARLTTGLFAIEGGVHAVRLVLADMVKAGYPDDEITKSMKLNMLAIRLAGTGAKLNAKERNAIMAEAHAILARKPDERTARMIVIKDASGVETKVSEAEILNRAASAASSMRKRVQPERETRGGGRPPRMTKGSPDATTPAPAPAPAPVQETPETKAEVKLSPRDKFNAAARDVSAMRANISQHMGALAHMMGADLKKAFAATLDDLLHTENALGRRADEIDALERKLNERAAK